MSSVLDFYFDRLEEVEIENKDSEQVLIVRNGRSINPITIYTTKKMLMFLDSNIECGDILTRQDGSSYFVVATQYSNACKSGQLKLVNNHVEIFTFKDRYEDLEIVGRDLIPLGMNVPAFTADVSIKMKSYDAGLLDQAIKTVLIRDNLNVNIMDGMKVDGRKYIVVSVDKARYKNMLFVQLGEETREYDDITYEKGEPLINEEEPLVTTEETNYEEEKVNEPTET